MRAFSDLFAALDETTSTNRKVAALVDYFEKAPPADAAWATHLLSGNRPKRLVNTRRLAAWAAEVAGIPLWLFEDSYDAVGDLAETIALLLPSGPGSDEPLHRVMEERLLPLAGAPEEAQREALEAAWRELDTRQLFLWNKLLTGGFRVGVSQKLVVRALAAVSGLEEAALAHRLAGAWSPSAEAFRALLSPDTTDTDASRPYPFFLAHPIETAVGSAGGGEEREPDGGRAGRKAGRSKGEAEEAAGDEAAGRGRAGPAEGRGGGEGPVGDASDVPAAFLARLAERLGPASLWQAEWKWDGIRAQLLHRAGGAFAWSRGGERIEERFPELERAAKLLPAGTVLDGEVLGWVVGEERPLPFAELQRRIGRKRVGRKILAEVPAVLVAYDLLETDGEDVRERPLAERRDALAEILGRLPAGSTLHLSPLVPGDSWDELAARRDEARGHGAEGLMVKRLASAYGVGRRRGDWWKWKVDPFTIDAVLLYAQRGHGRRASLYTDYTFGVWDGDRLVPVAKAYSGLTDAEIRRVDRFVRTHVTDRFGPVRAVEPRLVFEIAFEGIRESPRHKSGVALRFPRMARRREDKEPEEADTLETVRGLLG